MNNIENVANDIIPIMIKGMILIGIIVCLLSITISIYSFIKKKQSLKEIGLYLISTLGTGALISISGVLVNVIAHFDIDFSGYRHTIPLGYIVSLVVFSLFINVCNKSK